MAGKRRCLTGDSAGFYHFRQKNGGSAWESNPPGTVLAPHTGFEVRGPHQLAAHFRIGKTAINLRGIGVDVNEI